jgi:hypothetical protein
LDSIIESLRSKKLQLDLDEDRLRDELTKILLLFEDAGWREPLPYEEGIMDGSIPSGPYFPFRSEGWEGWGAIAIGIFEESEDSPDIDDSNRPSDGFVSYPQTFNSYT